MKKNNLFKAVGIVILAYILLSWIVPIIYGIGKFDGDVSYQIGFVSILSVVLETFTGFGTTILYILLVGGFYGVLKVTGAYEAIMDTLSSKFSGREKVVLIVIMVLMALISSITGLDLGLLVIFPILIGLIVKMGYDKIVALSATVGATIVGMYGATFAGTLYGANNVILGLDKYDKIIYKCILFVLALVGLILFTLRYASKNGLNSSKKNEFKSKIKKDKKNKFDKKVDAVKEKITLKGNRKSAVPALVVTGLLILAFILGTTNWAGIFKTNLFEKAHSAWTEFTIGNFAILNKLFGGVDALGSWYTPVRFQYYSILLVIAMIVIMLIYRTKLEDAFEGFVDGIKSFVVPAILTMLVCSVFVFVYYNPVIATVSNLLLTATKEFNVALSGIYVIINSIFYVDYYYLAYSVLYSISSVYTDSSVLSIISVMFANLYSLVMLIAPTSLLLVISLYISEVKYTEWFKYIWKFVVVLLVLSFVMFSVMLLV